MTFKLEITTGKHGDSLSQKYTCNGQDISPEIAWSDAPASTKSFILILEDPDAPKGALVHWILYNIKPDVKELHENIPKEAVTPEGFAQGINGFGNTGYNGPCPRGKRVHNYKFYLYAVLHPPDLSPGLRKKDLEKLIADKTIKQASVIMKYGR